VELPERAAWVGCVRMSYAEKFLPKIPTDFELTSLSQTLAMMRSSKNVIRA
jgi:hypothetical protein